MKKTIVFSLVLIFFISGLLFADGFAWECKDNDIGFRHKPSTYYGSGEYFTDCPNSTKGIRCYHYHRHWICEKDETYYWDRNLNSAAREACDCSLPEDTAPSAPAVSKKPETRFPESDPLVNPK